VKLKHVDIVTRSVSQDAREIATQFSKTFTTSFFPVGEEILAIAVDCVNYLRRDKLWASDDPLFPAIVSDRRGMQGMAPDEDVLTTFRNHGEVESRRQCEVTREFDHS